MVAGLEVVPPWLVVVVIKPVVVEVDTVLVVEVLTVTE